MGDIAVTVQKKFSIGFDGDRPKVAPFGCSPFFWLEDLWGEPGILHEL